MDHQAFAQMLGNYGEFIGAVAVVITLGFLVAQVRRSADETARASHQSASTAVGDLLLRISLDESAYELFCRGREEPDSLQEKERFRFHMMFYVVFDQWEMIHANWKRGRITDADWEKWNTIIVSYLSYEGVQRFWSALSHQFSSDFQSYIESLEPDRNYGFR